MDPIRLALVLHFHQPVGNFGEVFQEAFDRCYDPLLKTLEEEPEVRFTAHVSGPLLEWLAAHQPVALDRMKALSDAGRMEWLMGGFYEPILPVLSREDRLGQLVFMRRWIEDRFGHSPRGCWLAERVWEPSLAASLVEGGVHYTLLDDHLLAGAGFSGPQTHRSFLVEDGGACLGVLPISERLRYLIPFQSPEDLIEELARARESGGRMLVYGDDAEKFGLWPGTFEHVFTKGWLKAALQLLLEAREIVTLNTGWEALEGGGPPLATAIPAGSYREMEEWAAPRVEPSLAETRRRLQATPDGERAADIFLRGGSWRNFLVRYPEARRLHGRVSAASRLVREGSPAMAGEALREVFQAQCNCPYWHGVFGGVYLPHLRDALYSHLLRAEAMALREGEEGEEATPSRTTADFDLDGLEETAVTLSPVRALFKPDQGGRLFELSHLHAAWNPLICLSRRREAYHDELESLPPETRPVLVEDALPRDCLLDRLVPTLPDAVAWIQGRAALSVDLSDRPYQEEWRGGQLSLATDCALPSGTSLDLEKTVEVTRQGLKISYRVAHKAGPAPEGYLAVECNLGPGNHGGLSRLDADGPNGFELDPPALRQSPTWVRVRALARGDLFFHQEGASHLLTGPIWSHSRDEAGMRSDLQGTCLVFFAPLTELAASGAPFFHLRITLEPWN